MTTLKHWLRAFRLRTLPLALAGIGMGSFLAASHGWFNLQVFIWASLTTVFLQILSNIANDYGDSIHGADNTERIGPARMVQSGQISPKAMKTAMYVLVFLSFISGLMLLKAAFYPHNLTALWWFLGIGILAIIAAIAYTNGKRPYGYDGLGDVSVLIFFGYIAVAGVYYLHTNSFDWLIMLPATSSGLLAVAVLNLNNMRDIESDKLAGKYSIPVRLGYEKALVYHGLLCRIALICAVLYVVEIPYVKWYQYGFVFPIAYLLYKHIKEVSTKSPAELDSHLQELAIIALLFTILFGICIYLPTFYNTYLKM